MNLYPSIKLSEIKKLVILFARKITASTKKTINICLDLIQFGVRYTLIYLDEEYYKYHSGKNEEQGLEMEGYELALLSNLVVSYHFEKYKTLLNRTTYHGIYKYDDMVVFKGKKSVKEIKIGYWSFSKQWKRRWVTNTLIHLGNMDDRYKPYPP